MCFAGTAAVSVSFPLIFLRCFACVDDDTMGQLFYYAPFIAIFQFGWACTQIAHMALISQMTQDRSQQTGLSGFRLVDVDSCFGLSQLFLLYCQQKKTPVRGAFPYSRAQTYVKVKKVKEADLYSAFIEVPYTQGAQVRITQCYLQTTPYLPLPRKHSPGGASQD